MARRSVQTQAAILDGVATRALIPERMTQDDVEVDLLLGDQPWLDGALAQPTTDPADYPVLDLPYLALLKLAASRTQDLADIAQMLGWADEEQLTAVRAVVERYAPADSEDLEALIFLGQQERQSPD
jgi:hypothetical protein